MADPGELIAVAVDLENAFTARELAKKVFKNPTQEIAGLVHALAPRDAGNQVDRFSDGRAGGWAITPCDMPPAAAFLGASQGRSHAGQDLTDGSKGNLVEPRGIEPLTSSLRTTRSPI
jgi:hypothetical protein